MTQEFIRERQYLKAVSSYTLIWYGCSFKAFEGAFDSKEAIRERIVQLRQRNESPITSCIRMDKGFIKILKLKEEHKILETFSTGGHSRARRSGLPLAGSRINSDFA